jgi:hypothetical protein
VLLTGVDHDLAGPEPLDRLLVRGGQTLEQRPVHDRVPLPVVVVLERVRWARGQHHVRGHARHDLDGWLHVDQDGVR